MFKSLRVKTGFEKTDHGLGDISIAQVIGDDAANRWSDIQTDQLTTYAFPANTQGSVINFRKQKD